MPTNIKFTRAEELANAISHLSGAVLAVAGLILMINKTSVHGNAMHIFATTVFGVTMIVLYISSTMTHILPMGRLKDRFFNFDRIAIYFLIAGTYTPLALMAVGGTMGWVIFGVEWAFALVGTILILAKPGDYDTGVNTYYVVSYAVMGWLILIVAGTVIQVLPVMGWVWILIGAFCYSLGIVFFTMARFRYHHLVWHLLVIGGTLSHFFAVFFYVIPD